MFVWRWTFDCAKDHHSVRRTPALGFDITAHISYTATTIESNPILTQSSEWAQQTWLWPVTNLWVGLVRNGRFLIVVGVAARVAGPAVGGRGIQGLHSSRCLGQVNVHGKEVDGAIWQHTHTLLYNSESEYPLTPFPQMVHTGSGDNAHGLSNRGFLAANHPAVWVNQNVAINFLRKKHAQWPPCFLTS